MVALDTTDRGSNSSISGFETNRSGILILQWSLSVRVKRWYVHELPDRRMYLSQVLCCIFSNSDSKQEPHKFCSTRTYIPLYFLLLRLQGYEWVIGYLKSVYWARLNCKPTSIWGSFAFDSVTDQSTRLEYLALWVHVSRTLSANVTRSYLAVSLLWRWDQKIR